MNEDAERKILMLLFVIKKSILMLRENVCCIILHITLIQSIFTGKKKWLNIKEGLGVQ